MLRLCVKLTTTGRSHQGAKKAKEIKAKTYLECSAKDIPGVASVFQQAIRVVMDKDKKMWADVAKKAKKEDKKEQKVIAAIEKKKKKEGKKKEPEDPDSESDDDSDE